MNRGTLKGFSDRPNRSLSVISAPHAFGGGISALAIQSPSLSTASGACTAGEWKNVLEVRGGGMLKAATVRNANGATKNISLRIVLDGVEIFNRPVATSAVLTYVAIGQIVAGTTSSVMDDPQPFYRSLLVQYRADVSETDGSTIATRFDLRR